MIKRVPYCVSECGVSEICHQQNADDGFCLRPQAREAALFAEQKELRVLRIPTVPDPTSGGVARTILDIPMTLLLIGNLKRVHLEMLLNLQYGLQDIKRLHRLPSRDVSLMNHIRIEIERRTEEARLARDGHLDGMGRLMD